MPAHRPIRRTAAALAAATAAVVVALAPATPALAADSVQVSMGGLSSSYTAGQRPEPFQVRLTSRLKQGLASDVRVSFDIQMDGLQPDWVAITRGGGFPLNKTTNGNDIIFSDPEPILLRAGGSASRNYNLAFAPQTPEGDGQLTAIAVAGGSQAGSDSASFSVRASTNPTRGASPFPSVSPPPTVNVPLPSGTQVSVAPLGQAGRTTPLSNDSAGVPIFIYVMGGILVAMGAVILFMLFRNPREPEGAAVAGYPQPGPTYPPTYPPIDYPPQSGDPTSAYGPRQNTPTAVMPTVRDQRPTGAMSRTMPDRPTAQYPSAPTTQLPHVPGGHDPRNGGPGVDPWAHAE
jgi:hypothetical protein